MSWNHNALWGRHPAVTKGDERDRGQKAADLMKRMLATWAALGGVLLVIAVWITLNSSVTGGGDKFDPFPWILLNLCLSCFAALQCFVLLIANKRGEQIAAEIAQHTYENTVDEHRLLVENTELTRLVKLSTDRIDALGRQLDDVMATLRGGPGSDRP